MHEVNAEMRNVQKNLWQVGLVSILSLLVGSAVQVFDNYGYSMALLLLGVYFMGIYFIGVTSVHSFLAFVIDTGIKIHNIVDFLNFSNILYSHRIIQ
jgi:uncharacterized membrane protein (Fun14 family)